MASVPAQRRRAAPVRSPTPCVRLFADRIVVNRGTALRPDYRDLDAPLVALSFDYGGVRIPASDPRGRFFRHGDAGTSATARDAAAENAARRLLEHFGAIDLTCLDDYGSAPALAGGLAADYIVHPDADIHALCSFSAHAVPALRAAGWRVEIAPDYPCHIVSPDAPWYARVDPDGPDGGWFNLELGIEVDGRRVDLLPALLELLGRAGACTLERLSRSPRRFWAVPVGPAREGGYLPVPPERLRGLLEVVQELYDGRPAGERLRLSPLQAACLARLDAALPAGRTRWRDRGGLRRRARSLAGGPAAPAAAPQRLRATLRPYQQHGLAWLQHLRAHGAAGILADDMGLGKTLQTIAHIAVEKQAGRLTAPALVVAPTSLVGNWRRELATFAPHIEPLILHGPGRRALIGRISSCEVAITTYPLLLRDAELLAEHSYHLLILDEAQAIKNHRSRVHRAARSLTARHRLCLTGTPLENNVDELWSLFDFLMPGFLGDLDRFRALYRSPIEREGGGDGGGRALAALRQRLQPFILRRMKDRVARELPPKTEIIRPVRITGAQRDLYESIRIAAHAKVRRTIRASGIARSTIAIFDALMKLRQVCCDPRLVSIGAARRADSSAKLSLLRELLGAQLGEGRRVLVFSQFTSMLALISERLALDGIAHLTLTGATPRRQKIVDAFEGGRADVFLISLKAGGTGLNLTSADTVIHYDPWWNPAAQAQATDRAYRIGQDKPVFVYNLIVSGSVEDKMMALQERKRRLAAALLAGGDGAAAPLSAGDVDDLFAPLAG